MDPIQGGAGTSLNMNANEVIANRAIEPLGGNKGDYSIINLNDDKLQSIDKRCDSYGRQDDFVTSSENLKHELSAARCFVQKSRGIQRCH